MEGLTARSPQSRRYAIVGIGCRFPGGASTPDAFWNLLAEGRDAVTEIPSDRPDWDTLYDPDPAATGRIYTRFGGFVDDVDKFDARFFGISPREASRMDPQQRMLLEVVWHAFEDARIDMDTLAGSPTGVFIGISTHDYADVQMYPQNRDSIDAHSNTGGATSIAANRISYAYDFRGPSFTVDSACSSSLTAIHLACRALDADDCTLAVAGGVQLLLRPELSVGFCRATMLSVDCRCKAFDADGNGYVRSEGAGAVVLKALDRAVADGDAIHAVILGSAINQDGRSPGMTVPSEASQAAMLRTSLGRAGVEPHMVQYVEAHGTGTSVGDPIEARAIGSVFSQDRPDDEPLRIGSVKSNIGHLEAAAGMAGLIKTALAIRHRQIPPSLHFASWNPAIDPKALKLQMTTALEPWPSTASPPTAAVSSFGFGGANASVVLGAAPDAAPLTSSEGQPQAEVLPLSARSPEALRALALAHAELLLAGGDAVAALCGAAALGRTHHDHRVAVAGATRDALADALESFAAGERAPSIASGRASAGAKIAFVFSGMGPQWWAMGRQLLEREPVFMEMMDRCDAALRPHAEWSLLDEFRADEAASRLAHPQLAQVTNFALQVSLAAVWREWGIAPEAVLGHSGGAMAAAYEAGVHSLEDAMWLAFHRSRLQGRESNGGAMLAVGLPDSEAPGLLAGSESSVSLAAVNGPAAMTLSGDPETLLRIADELTARQVFARMLPVTIAYHSPNMDPIRDEFLHAVAGLTGQTARLPFVSDTTGTFEDGADCDPAYWWRAIRQPVRFADSMATLTAAGFTRFVEVSPHPVLASSIAECVSASGGQAVVVPSLRRNEDERSTMLRSLGTLYANGASPAWNALYRRNTTVELPLYPFQRERHWFEPVEGAAGEGPEPAGEADPNPLLGRRLASVQPGWEAHLGSASLSYLDDHVIQGTVIFPGAGYVAAALAAGRRLHPSGDVVVRDVTFQRPLVLDDRQTVALQTIVDPETQKVRIHAGPRADRSTWDTYSTGRISAGSGASESELDLALLQARLGAPREPRDFYQALHRRGLSYGPRFKGITELRFADGEALARIGPLDDLAPDVDGVHPALLDAAFQLLAVVAGSARADDRLFLPTGVDEIRLRRPSGGSLWVHCILETITESHVVGTFELVDADGAPVLSVKGFRAQLVQGGASEDAVDEWLYEHRWEAKPLEVLDEPPARASVLRADVAALTEHLEPVMAEIEADTDWPRYYTDAEPALTQLAAAHVLAAFAQLGLPTTPGTILTTADVAAATDREPSGGAWVQRLLGLLIDSGCVEAMDDGWRVVRMPDAEGVAERLPGYETDIALLAQAGTTLAAALAGDAAGRDAAFTAEALPLLTRFYRDAPASAFYNRVLGQVVGALVDTAAPGGSIRVLEVGAGTGGATGALLERLPADLTSYLFTDSAPLLVDAAEQRFTDMAHVRAAVLDVTTDTDDQGLQPASFDLIVAANVVHATPDVRSTLARLRRLLLPGGVLVLVEITRHPRWLDVIFGQTRGWWSFTDRDLRQEHPLLESAQWDTPLLDAGFENVWVSEETGAVGEQAQSVIVASAPAQPAEASRWVVVTDSGGGAAAVCEGLRRLGHETVETGTATALTEIDQLAAPPAGVVILWDRSDGDDFAGAQAAGVHAALPLLQGVLERPPLRTRPVFLVTTGAMRVPVDASDDAAHSTIWGLGRTVLKEHPEQLLRLVDIGPTPGPTEVAGLLRELTEHDLDEEIALRGEQRFVRRLRREALRDLGTRTDLPAPEELQWRAEIGTRGSLGSLRLREFRPAPPAADEVQIAVKAASLNFRDVMLAMGGIPGLEDEMSFGHRQLGSDCSGIVTAVGASVTSVQPGDAVLAMAPGSLASSTTTSASLVARKPDAMTFQQAASAPTVFLTAWYALHHLARIRRGEKVLIHAATGGVGLAAIQIARDAGAEIFATAGSDTKRAHLRSLGIEHVMDSRSLAFADQIDQSTGGAGVDVVLNSLTGEAIERGMACLKPYGRFLEIGKLDIYSNADLALGRFRQNLSYFAIDLDRLCAERPEFVGEMLQELATAFEDGRFEPVVGHDLPMSDLEEALRLMAQAKHVGKVVVSHTEQQPAMPRVGGLDRLLRRDGTYLITGGLGGFGLQVAEHLAQAAPGAIVLMGRRAPSDEAAKRIDVLRSKGITVEVMRGDVSEAADVDAVCGRIERELPPLRGVFHGAMVLDDRRLEDLDAASLDRVLAPKALGAWNLHRRTSDQQLDLFVMFSSISSLLGNPLQANYGAASAYLDALAHHRRAAGLPALTINWGVLAGTGYVAERPELQQFLAQQGYLAFSTEQALTALDALLDRDAAQVMAARIDWRQLAVHSAYAAASPRIAGLIPADDEHEQSGSTSEVVLALQEASPDERSALAEAVVAGMLGRVLGTPADQVDPETPIDEMGVDSLLAVELMTMLSEQVGLELPVMSLISGMTVRKLGAQVVADLDVGAARRPAAKARRSVATVATTDAAPAVEELAEENQDIPAEVAAAVTPYATLDYQRWSPLQKLAKVVSTAGLRVLGDTDVEGLENLPATGPYIVAVNHLSMADVPLAMTVMPRRTIIIATDELRRFAVLDWLVGRVGQAIWMPKGGDPMAALDAALQVLASGGVLALAPEGVRNRTGLGRAQPGVAWLAQRSGLPVVPYVAWGQEQWRGHVRRLRRMDVAVRIGAPIPPPQPGAGDAVLRAYTDTVMRSLAGMLPEEYRGVYATPVRPGSDSVGRT